MRQMIADGIKVQMCVTSPPLLGASGEYPPAYAPLHDERTAQRGIIFA